MMATYTTEVGFHYSRDAYLEATPVGIDSMEVPSTYTFDNFFHPYVGELIEQLNKKSLLGLLDPDFLAGLNTAAAAAKVAWAASKDYAVGDCIKPTSSRAGSTLYYECTTP